LKENSDVKAELCIPAVATICNSTETPETDLHFKEVSETNFVAIQADAPNKNFPEKSTDPKDAPKIVMDCMPVDTPLDGNEASTLGMS